MTDPQHLEPAQHADPDGPAKGWSAAEVDPDEYSDGALSATVTEMAAKGGGLTDAQAQAAAKAGAEAALAELGDALSALPDEGAEA